MLLGRDTGERLDLRQETQTAEQMSVQQMAGEERQQVRKPKKKPNLKLLKFVFSSAFVEKAAVFPPTSVRGAPISTEKMGESWETWGLNRSFPFIGGEAGQVLRGRGAVTANSLSLLLLM